MTEIRINFLEISDNEDFYTAIGEQVILPLHFGNNLDALADWLKNEAPKPLKLELENMSLAQLEEFEELTDILDEVSAEDDQVEYRIIMLSYGE